MQNKSAKFQDTTPDSKKVLVSEFVKSGITCIKSLILTGHWQNR